MKKILLFLLAALVITLSGVSTGYSTEANQTAALYSIQDGDGYTYQHVYIEGKHYVYVYQGDLLVDVYEVEE